MSVVVKKDSVVYKGVNVKVSVPGKRLVWKTKRVRRLGRPRNDGVRFKTVTYPVTVPCTETKQLPAVAVLLIPKGAHARTRIGDGVGKNRASEALVLSIESPDGLTHYKVAVPPMYNKGRYRHTKYRVGKTTLPHHFDHGYSDCSDGIHFYARRREALLAVGVTDDKVLAQG